MKQPIKNLNIQREIMKIGKNSGRIMSLRFLHRININPYKISKQKHLIHIHIEYQFAVDKNQKQTKTKNYGDL